MATSSRSLEDISKMSWDISEILNLLVNLSITYVWMYWKFSLAENLNSANLGCVICIKNWEPWLNVLPRYPRPLIPTQCNFDNTFTTRTQFNINRLNLVWVFKERLTQYKMRSSELIIIKKSANYLMSWKSLGMSKSWIHIQEMVKVSPVSLLEDLSLKTPLSSGSDSLKYICILRNHSYWAKDCKLHYLDTWWCPLWCEMSFRRIRSS